jgi:hypothetical protein
MASRAIGNLFVVLGARDPGPGTCACLTTIASATVTCAPLRDSTWTVTRSSVTLPLVASCGEILRSYLSCS